MDLFDKTKEMIDKAKEDHQEKKELEYELNKDNPEYLFRATSKVGDLEVDSIHELFRVKNAKADFSIKKKKGLISKTANAALFVGTAGMSTVVKASVKGVKSLSRKPDSVYRYEELIEFELLEDDIQVSSGGLGRALAGGIAFGGAGAVVGGVTGKKTTKKVIQSMVIRITLDDIDNPIIMLPIITSKAKTGSKDYMEAFNISQKIIATLNVIANSNESDSVQKVEVVGVTGAQIDNQGSSNLSQIKELKELLDMGIITQEDFDAKKKELLGL